MCYSCPCGLIVLIYQVTSQYSHSASATGEMPCYSENVARKYKRDPAALLKVDNEEICLPRVGVSYVDQLVRQRWLAGGPSSEGGVQLGDQIHYVSARGAGGEACLGCHMVLDLRLRRWLIVVLNCYTQHMGNEGPDHFLLGISRTWPDRGPPSPPAQVHD